MSAPLPSFLRLLAKLRTGAADRVLERAAIIAEACHIPYELADVRDYEQEAHEQRGLPGVGDE